MNKDRIFFEPGRWRFQAVAFFLAIFLKAGAGNLAANPADEPDFYAFAAENLNGKSVSFGNYRGKVVLLNFWANWCKPCLNEFPELEKLYINYKDRGLHVIGLSITENRRGIEIFVKKSGVTFPILMDSGEAISDSYQVSDMPTTVLLDGRGKVILRVTGFSKEGIAEITSALEKLLP